MGNGDERVWNTVQAKAFQEGASLSRFPCRTPAAHTRPNNEGWWTLCIDGASRQSGAGIGLQLTSPIGERIEQAVRLGFNASNNESEYEALIAGVELALAVGADNLLIRSDSQLVVGQVNAEFESREPRMAKIVSLVRQKLSTFSTWKLEHVPRDRNERADALAFVAASFPVRETIYLPIYYKPDSFILHTQISQIKETPPSWMDPIRLYIATGELPYDRVRAHKIQIQSARFSIIDGQLYKRSLGGPYLKCLTPEQGQYVLAKLHEGVCENHPGGRTLAHQAHTQGYYWPTMKSDAANYVRKCDPCQRMSPILRSPVQDLVSISSPWTFVQWGIDIVGPFPTAPAQKKLLLVVTDYFSKWIEAEAFASIKDRDFTRFIWKNIVCQFGIPRTIVSDNGPQFDSRLYPDFCQKLKIQNLYFTPWYPQSNGQDEASNKTLLTALKKRLDSAKGKWVEELPGVLWAYRTMTRRPTGVSPFALTYGMEAVIPTEIDLPTSRTTMLNSANEESLIKELDTSDELQETAAVRMASYQRRLANSYNKRVKPRMFQPGDLVLRKVFENTADPTAGKFQPNWESPYLVRRLGEPGSYAIDKIDGTPVPRMWNVMHLKRYYQ